MDKINTCINPNHVQKPEIFFCILIDRGGIKLHIKSRCNSPRLKTGQHSRENGRRPKSSENFRLRPCRLYGNVRQKKDSSR